VFPVLFELEMDGRVVDGGGEDGLGDVEDGGVAAVDAAEGGDLVGWEVGADVDVLPGVGLVGGGAVFVDLQPLGEVFFADVALEGVGEEGEGLALALALGVDRDVEGGEFLGTE
jgi:hypothetical protein